MMMRPGRGMRAGAMGAGGAPVEKSKDFWGTLRRLLRRLGPDRFRILVALAFGVVSVGFTVSGPRILGNATNVLFNGVIGKLLHPGATKSQAIASLRAQGESQIASMISAMNVTPGKGVDIGELGKVAAQLKRQLGVRPEVAFAAPGSLRRTDLKSRRVRDERGPS